MFFIFFFFYIYCDHRDLHVLTHAFPPRRSSDLASRRRGLAPSPAKAGEGWGGVLLDQPGPWAPPPSLPLPSQGEGLSESSRLPPLLHDDPHPPCGRAAIIPA